MAAETDNEKNAKKGGKKGGRIALIICLILIIILLGVIIFLLLRKQAPAAANADTGPERETLVTEENAERVAEDFFKGTPDNVPQAYTVTMSADWTFEDGSSPSLDSYVENSTFNSTPVYFDIVTEGEGDVLYQSPIIPVGKHISKIKLDKDLDPGKYNCICVYHLVDENGQTLTTVQVTVKITVKN